MKKNNLIVLLTPMQRVIELSPAASGAEYVPPERVHRWTWPVGTWYQRRLAEIHKQSPAELAVVK